MRPHGWERVRRFWEADRGLTIVLVLLVVIIFVLPVVLNPDPAGRLGVEFAFSMLRLAGAFTTAESRRLRLAAVALTAATLLVRWGAAGSPSNALAIGREATTLVMLLLFRYAPAVCWGGCSTGVSQRPGHPLPHPGRHRSVAADRAGLCGCLRWFMRMPTNWCI